MDLKKAKKSTIIMAIGFFFMTLTFFSNLSRISSLKGATNLIYNAFPGMAFLSVGSYFSIKNSKLSKASYILFFITELVFLSFLAFGIILKYIPLESEDIINVIALLLNILLAFISTLLAISYSLYANGLKNVFIKINNKKMVSYSWVMGFAVTKLVIISIALPVVKINNISPTVTVVLSVLVDFVIQFGYFIFMIISAIELDKEIKKKKRN